MKIVILIISISLLFGSCKAYQDTIDSPSALKKKTHIITTNDGRVIKSKVIYNDNDTITYYKKGKEETIALSDIKTLKTKRYSKKKAANSFLITISLILSIITY